MKYYCTRQRAGPLTKECRSRRPRLSENDDAWTRTEKNKILRSPHSAVCRSSVDRLELRLALFGFHGVMHTLTFAPDKLPQNFRDVRRALRAFFARARRARGGPFDYVYIIEGLHHRFHIHLVVSDKDFRAADIESLWRNGRTESEPVLKGSGGFRRLARYLNKERSDGAVIPVGRHPWSASRTLNDKLPPVERWKDDSPEIPVPPVTYWQTSADVKNDFGEHHYKSWIAIPDTFRIPFLET